MIASVSRCNRAGKETGTAKPILRCLPSLRNSWASGYLLMVWPVLKT